MARMRHARGDDVEAMREIAIKAWEPIYEGYRKAMGDELFTVLHKDWRKRKADAVQRHFELHPEWTLVTEKEGKVVGFITFSLDQEKKIGEIGNNAIHPQHQGRGLGTAQYRRVLSIFREEGMTYASVETGLDEAHAPARAAYEKVGFKKTIPGAVYYLKLQ